MKMKLCDISSRRLKDPTALLYKLVRDAVINSEASNAVKIATLSLVTHELLANMQAEIDADG